MCARRTCAAVGRHWSRTYFSQTLRPPPSPWPWLCPTTSERSASSAARPEEITLEDKVFKTDEWMNTPSSILSAIPRRLHLQRNHPLAITRQLVESRFPDYIHHNDLSPIVTVNQNFDSLGFPADHIGRSRTDTYYLNRDTVLRTHTSAHQADTFRANESAGYLISADVYRRDAIDRSHYPVFHQMEGARTWDRKSTAGSSSTLEEMVWQDVAKIPKHNIKVEDPSPMYHRERNPLQKAHSAEEVAAIAAHLKRSLEDVVVAIFDAARIATGEASATTPEEPLKVRWVEAYFPFTSPSWELEVLWEGEWLEILGCGVVQQSILNNAGSPDRLGWAFGMGLERIAMLLYSIPDIRLFWSTDPRFLSQFCADSPIRRFVPFSKYPACVKDVSFWLRSSSGASGGLSRTAVAPVDFHENDVMEIARDVCGNVVEHVGLVDEFVHPKTGRKSLCYRINYRSLERTLTNEETNQLHEKFRRQLVEKLGVELR